MNSEEITTALDKIIYVVNNWDYRVSSSKLEEIVDEFSQEDFINFITSEEVKTRLFDGTNKWYTNNVVNSFLNKYPTAGDSILKDASSDVLCNLCLNNGFYSDLKLINAIALNDSLPESQAFAAHLCDIATLRELKSAKSHKVRSVVFQRLGPVEALDDMLKDRKANIRTEGVRYAPHGYAKLSEMTKEISGSVFRILVNKIKISEIPLMLANRNLKNNWQQRSLQDRLERGY
tara:strand:+ start:480 stop:1178 length:699 start_codon:yes stop_codon:yes gene_type:complete